MRRDFKCETCDKLYSQKEALKRHILVVHERRLDHQCDSCPKAFSLNVELTRHMKNVHKHSEKSNI